MRTTTGTEQRQNSSLWWDRVKPVVNQRKGEKMSFELRNRVRNWVTRGVHTQARASQSSKARGLCSLTSPTTTGERPFFHLFLHCYCLQFGTSIHAESACYLVSLVKSTAICLSVCLSGLHHGLQHGPRWTLAGSPNNENATHTLRMHTSQSNLSLRSFYQESRYSRCLPRSSRQDPYSIPVLEAIGFHMRSPAAWRSTHSPYSLP